IAPPMTALERCRGRLRVDFGPMQRPPFSFDERDTLVNIDSYTVEGRVTTRSFIPAQHGHAS
ncbi:hypothetical protein PQR46_40390, partial [Paraburkholderia sediminicola]|uniref:hypothetical protein n=1 Tax=Paraburkholderia sediminicola TaxID=458836 RepID=UPI0038B77309